MGRHLPTWFTLICLLAACDKQVDQASDSSIKAIQNDRSSRVYRIQNPNQELNLPSSFLLVVGTQTEATAKLVQDTTGFLPDDAAAASSNAIPVICDPFTAKEEKFLELLGFPAAANYVPTKTIEEAQSLFSFTNKAPFECFKGPSPNETYFITNTDIKVGEQTTVKTEYWVVKQAPETLENQIYSFGCTNVMQALGYDPAQAQLDFRDTLVNIYGPGVYDFNCNIGDQTLDKRSYLTQKAAVAGMLIVNDDPTRVGTLPPLFPVVVIQNEAGANRYHRIECRSNPAALNQIIKGLNIGESVESLPRYRLTDPFIQQQNILQERTLSCRDDGVAPTNPRFLRKVENNAGTITDLGVYYFDPKQDVGQKKYFFDLGCSTLLEPLGYNPKATSPANGGFAGQQIEASLRANPNNTIYSLNCGESEQYRKLVHGAYHSCALKNDKLGCWFSTPTTEEQVVGQTQLAEQLKDASVQDIAAGWQHSCAISNGKVSCSGLKNVIAGQPVFKNPKRIWAGPFHTCVEDETLQCWGYDFKDGRTAPPAFTGDLLDVQLSLTGGCLLSGTAGRNELKCWGKQDAFRDQLAAAPEARRNIKKFHLGEDFLCVQKNGTSPASTQCFGERGLVLQEKLKNLIAEKGLSGAEVVDVDFQDVQACQLVRSQEGELKDGAYSLMCSGTDAGLLQDVPVGRINLDQFAPALLPGRACVRDGAGIRCFDEYGLSPLNGPWRNALVPQRFR